MEDCENKLICIKCGNVLISGKGNFIAMFGKGTSIECLKCGNKHVFGETTLENISKTIKFIT